MTLQQKLKIDKFTKISVKNFPPEYALELKSVKTNVEVIIYYIKELSDVKKFVELCQSSSLPKDNRVILVFEKGRKDGVNRDSILAPFRNDEYKGFKMKAPMLCSISDKLSAFVQEYNIV